MKTRYTTASALAVFLLFCWCQAWATAEGDASAAREAAKTAPGPKLVIEEKNFHYGRINEGDTLSHEFAVKNEGTEPLKILNVRPG